MMERGFAPEICELAVVGAGPAGMAAATLAAQLGVDTVLIDERPAPGGAMYGGLASGREEQSATFGMDYAHGAPLIEAFRAAKLTYVDRARVCGLSGSEDAFELCVATQGESRVVRARRIVLAPGALERPLPIVGGALPGVGYAGATMRELKSSLRFPEGRVVLAGCGPLLYAAASALRRAGAEVVAMLDTLNVRHFVRALPHALGFMRSPYYAPGAKLLQEVNDNIPIYHDVIELAALGNDKLASVRFTSNRRTVTLIADALLLHQGIVPDIRLADRLGCAIGWDDQLAGWTVSVDAWGASSVAGAVRRRRRCRDRRCGARRSITAASARSRLPARSGTSTARRATGKRRRIAARSPTRCAGADFSTGCTGRHSASACLRDRRSSVVAKASPPIR